MYPGNFIHQPGCQNYGRPDQENSPSGLPKGVTSCHPADADTSCLLEAESAIFTMLTVLNDLWDARLQCWQ